MSAGGAYYNVGKFIAHPEFNKPPFAFDIGLMQIAGKIEFSDRIQPIKLSPNEVPNDSLLKLSKLAFFWFLITYCGEWNFIFLIFLAGWGRISVRNAPFSEFVDVSISLLVFYLNYLLDRWTITATFTSN